VTIVPILVFIIIIRVLFLYVVFPCCCSCFGQSQVITLRGAIVTVAGGNILDGL
jgi:hypothetical protein